MSNPETIEFPQTEVFYTGSYNIMKVVVRNKKYPTRFSSVSLLLSVGKAAVPSLISKYFSK